MDGVTLQRDTHIDTIKLKDDPKSCIAYKREDSPSPVDTFDWDKFFSTTESSAQEVLVSHSGTRPLQELHNARALGSPSPELPIPPSHLPAPYPLAENSQSSKCCNNRVLSPSPEPFTPLVQSSGGYFTNSYMSSPTPEPNTSKVFLEPAMDVDVENPTNHLFRATEVLSPESATSCRLGENDLQRVCNTSATNLGPEPLAVAHSQENMSSAAPAIWTSPARSLQNALRTVPSSNKPTHQQTRRQPLNGIIKPLPNRPQTQALNPASSIGQRDKANLRIRNKQTGETTNCTAPKDMVLIVILQGGAIQISWRAKV
ncbi:hypothetical protein IFR05_016130 [Cadophora sp. M221]|nr:hypothetical protein IFR05_016130 [Cadophora sp. M221]